MARFLFGDYLLNTRKSEIYHKNKVLELEPQIYCILELLITRHGEIVSRNDIIDAVWDGRDISDNVIDNRIKSARAAIGDNGKAQRYIKTYPRQGYKFIGDVRIANENEAAPSNETTDSRPLTESEGAVATHPSRKGLSFLQNATALKIAAVAIASVFGFYFLSQSSSSKIVQTPAVSEVSDEEAIYTLALSDEPNALPRVAVLPFETIGDDASYGFLPEILKNEFNHTITGIDGITVVSLSSDVEFKNELANYKMLRNAFGLDYAIASKMTPYGDDYKLNVSLIRVEDGKVLYNEPYDLNVSSKDDLEDLPAVIARKTTLMTANQLNLSVDHLPQSWGNYDFYKKYEKAKRISLRRDYENAKRAADLLREVIAEEPNFILAYKDLINQLSLQVVFYVDDYKVIGKEQIELAKKMKEISPEAPETRIINAFMKTYDEGINKGLMGTAAKGEYNPNDPLSVAEHVLKTDPDNIEAHITLSGYAKNFEKPAEAIKLLERTLRLMPTHDWQLAYYIESLSCNEDIPKSRTVLKRALQWHPESRQLLLEDIRQDRLFGNYESALIKIKRLLDQGYITSLEMRQLSYVFVDLGHPDLALPHVRYSLVKSHLYALMGDTESLLKEVNVNRRIYGIEKARLIADEAYLPENYIVARAYKDVGAPNDTTKAHFCQLPSLIRDTYMLKKTGSEKYESFLPVVTDYFEGRDVEGLRTQEEFITLMGLHVLQGDHDKAIEVMDAAIDRGFLFIGALKEPYLRELVVHPGFTERLETMQKSADAYVKEYFSDQL